jgi:hypothetical protein
MEYRYMEFKTEKGDSLYSEVFDTCLTPAGYKELWDSVGPPLRILPMYLNRRFNVTYHFDSIFSPFNENDKIKGLVIQKMELIR